MMAAERETVDRQFGVVNVQPDFAAIPSGLQPKPASPLAAQHQDWSRIPEERLEDGVFRQLVVGRDLMVCRLRFPPHTVTADHRHPHEQMTLVEKGRVRFTFGDETREARAGDVLFFPSNFWHGARILDEETVLVDIFTPVRKDFLEEGDAARG
jgi:quercetin dioxygenase-like cupin family protein